MKAEKQIRISQVSDIQGDFFKNVVHDPQTCLTLVSTESNKLLCLDDKFESRFQKNSYDLIYDVALIPNPAFEGLRFIASYKNQPVKFFHNEKVVHTIGIKKQGTEDFYSPLKIDALNNRALFAGLHLLKVIDLDKLVINASLEKIEAKQQQDFSDGLFVTDDFLVYGRFNGQFSGVDLRDQKSKCFTNTTHFDAINCMVRFSDYHFLTGARKDDNVYLWVD